MKKNKRRRKPRKSDKFWSGSGKFFLTMIIFYAAFVGVSELIDHAKNEEIQYKKEDIEITGIQIISKDLILKLCGFGHQTEQKIDIDIQEVAARIMDLKYIKGVSITRRLPRKLNITVEEREPIAFIYGKGLNLIDRQGYLIPVPQVTHMWDVPLISGISQGLGSLGEITSSSEALVALEILEYIRINHSLIYGFISEINMSDPEYVDIVLIRGGTNIRINRAEYRREVHIFKNYLVHYLDWKDLERIEYIDLRFRDQLILRYKT